MTIPESTLVLQGGKLQGDGMQGLRHIKVGSAVLSLLQVCACLLSDLGASEMPMRR